MEEVDNIILHFLRHLNVKIGEDIKQITDLPVDVILASVSQCLSTINPSYKLPQKIPQGISHKVEVAAQLATMCKDMGYKNDVGYQTFLYCNEADLRQVFMFLIEHLPSDGQQHRPAIEPCDRKSILYRNISRKIHEELNAVWIPHNCNPEEKIKVGDFIHKDYSPTTLVNVDVVNIEMLKEQLLKIKQSNSSVTQDPLAKSSSRNKLNTLINNEKTIEGEHHRIKEFKSNKPLKELREEVIILRQKLSTMEGVKKVSNTEFLKIQKLKDQAEEELSSIQNSLQDINMNEGGGVNDILERIRNIVQSLHCKSEELTSKIMSLKSDIDKLHTTLPQSQKNECKRILLSLKETAKSLREEYSSKEELREQLKKEYSKLSQGVKRSTYTKRILEIISNVDKQNLEINKILEDTKGLQKEINTLDGQLDRCFSLADETLFKDAKKDDQAKKAYKLLALLHSECNTIIALVNDTGVLAREIVDIEDHIKVEKTKHTEETLKRIQNDISKLQEESIKH